MDYAVERFGKSFVGDVKAVLNVCVIFCMYPVFWALYDQQVGEEKKIRHFSSANFDARI